MSEIFNILSEGLKLCVKDTFGASWKYEFRDVDRVEIVFLLHTSYVGNLKKVKKLHFQNFNSSRMGEN